MSNPSENQPSPWRDVQLEAAAQFSALAMLIGSGRNPWDQAEAARREANRHIKTARRMDFLVV